VLHDWLRRNYSFHSDVFDLPHHLFGLETFMILLEIRQDLCQRSLMAAVVIDVFVVDKRF
jgi:hypothetical protein